MSVINPDEWLRAREHRAEVSGFTENEALIFLALLDIARYGTVQWFPDTDPADVPWAPEPDPEWVRCVDEANGTQLTKGRIYRVIRHGRDAIRVRTDRGIEGWFDERRFVPASADEATVTIDVPVAWARWAAAKPWVPDGTRMWPGPGPETFVRDACREALTKAGLL